MYRQFYGLSKTPFTKDIPASSVFSSRNLEEFLSRMEYFKTVRGIALVWGEPGTGKTTSMRTFIESLNLQTHMPVYLPLSTLTVMDFYRHLALGLGLLPRFRKVDLFHQVQERIASLSAQKAQIPVIILDEAQHLRNDLLHDLQMIFNFNMDSKNPAMVILCGTPTIVPMLRIHVHEGLFQRVIVHHEFSGLGPDEADNYLKAMLRVAGSSSPIFTPDAATAIFEASRGKPRLINALASKSLLIGAAREARTIDSKIVQEAAMDALQLST